MPVKIYVPVEGRQETVRLLLAAAEEAGLDASHVRTEKTRGYGYIVSDDLAKHLGVAEDKDEVSASEVKKLDVDPAADGVDDSDGAEKSDKPKRGRPAGSKSAKGASDGE